MSSRFELRDVVKHYPSGGETVRDRRRLADDRARRIRRPVRPSGSGKTTLLLLAAGLMAPDSGSILFGDRDVGSMSERESASYRLRDVGFVFQSFHLMPTSTAVENAIIKLPLLGYTAREAREKVAGAGRHRRSTRPPPRATVDRTAPARRHRPRARGQTTPTARRRAHRQPRLHSHP